MLIETWSCLIETCALYHITHCHAFQTICCCIGLLNYSWNHDHTLLIYSHTCRILSTHVAYNVHCWFHFQFSAIVNLSSREIARTDYDILVGSRPWFFAWFGGCVSSLMPALTPLESARICLQYAKSKKCRPSSIWTAQSFQQRRLQAQDGLAFNVRWRGN